MDGLGGLYIIWRDSKLAKYIGFEVRSKWTLTDLKSLGQSLFRVVKCSD